jgi:transcriptional regulator with XRE-family HTH domain
MVRVVENTFGPMLKSWRVARRLTQERLAMDAEVSPRHLSCVETGRARPSREMVLVLASALDVPLRERNALLASAGYAAVYRETDLDAPAMDHIRRALDFLLARHEPYGAVVVDAAWDVRKANQGAWRMFAALLGGEAPGPGVTFNVMRMLFEPAGLRAICVNWEEVVSAVIERAHREALIEGPRSAAARALAGVLATPGMPSRFARPSPGRTMPLVIPVHLRKAGLDLRLFSTITTLGTPADVTAQELRIESWFPADDATDHWIRSLA